MKKIQEVTSYGRPRIRVSTVNEKPSMTQQAFAEDCDVNIILDRFMKTGQLPQSRPGFYQDVSEVPDLTQAIGIVQTAQEAFESLPAKVRFEFQNDPAQLLQFISNPANRAKAEELGLIEKKPEEKKETGA